MKEPSRRDGVIWTEVTFHTLRGEHISRPTHTVPYGTDRSLTVFLAVNCQATISQSLRDTNHSCCFDSEVGTTRTACRAVGHSASSVESALRRHEDEKNGHSFGANSANNFS